MFANDTNLFLSNKGISKLFSDMNFELQKKPVKTGQKKQQANNISLNLIKKWTLFHQSKIKCLTANDLPTFYLEGKP